MRRQVPYLQQCVYIDLCSLGAFGQSAALRPVSSAWPYDGLNGLWHCRLAGNVWLKVQFRMKLIHITEPVYAVLLENGCTKSGAVGDCCRLSSRRNPQARADAAVAVDRSKSPVLLYWLTGLLGTSKKRIFKTCGEKNLSSIWKDEGTKTSWKIKHASIVCPVIYVKRGQHICV